MKTKMLLDQASSIARDLVYKLAPCCQRIEIAGSVRRKKPEVGDIELIAIPKFETDLFGNITEDHALDHFDWEMIGRLVKNGHKYKQVSLEAGINLDLFIVTPPAQWGVQFLIRTGSSEYSRKFVTLRKYGGMLPSNMRVKDGAIWNGETMLITPEEEDVYRLIGQPYIEPQGRM